MAKYDGSAQSHKTQYAIYDIKINLLEINMYKWR